MSFSFYHDVRRNHLRKYRPFTLNILSGVRYLVGNDSFLPAVKVNVQLILEQVRKAQIGSRRIAVHFL
jgi:hypothetical protein